MRVIVLVQVGMSIPIGFPEASVRILTVICLFVVSSYVNAAYVLQVLQVSQ